MLNLPKHPQERKTKCPVCGTDYVTLPIRRGASPDKPFENILEQHVCPNGHVYVTEIGKDEMLADY
jgi:rubredoxin